MRRLPCLLVLSSALALVNASSALAEGANTLNAAPVVAFGQQEFGTLTTITSGGGENRTYFSWWLLPLIARDKLTIDWEGQQDEDKLYLYRPGTNEFNYSKEEQTVVARNELGGAKKTESTYEASETGSFPLAFIFFHDDGPTPGPYSFTAYVIHALSVGLPRVAALHRTGTLTVPVHNPEGGPIENPAVEVELQINARGAWHKIGTASVTDSAAVIAYRVPGRFRHLHATLRALAHGTGYTPASSPHLKVRTL